MTKKESIDRPVQDCRICGSAYFPEVGCLHCRLKNWLAIAAVNRHAREATYIDKSQPKELND